MLFQQPMFKYLDQILFVKTGDFNVCYREAMTIIWIGIYVGFLFTPGNGNASTAPCKISHIQSPVTDRACEPPEYTNISTSELRHCSLACVHHRKCKAIIFDGRHSVCMILPQQCLLLDPRVNHVYQSFEYSCTKWVNVNDAVDTYWVYETLGNKAYVARAFMDNDLIIGKLTRDFHAITPSGTKRRGGSDLEKIVVDALCNVTWVPCDAIIGQAMPAGAVIGGFLAVTNTPLYVSRLATLNCRWALGYYNPLNQKAWGECYGVQSSYIFEVMVAEPRDAIIWLVYLLDLQGIRSLLGGLNVALSLS